MVLETVLDVLHLMFHLSIKASRNAINHIKLDERDAD